MKRLASRFFLFLLIQAALYVVFVYTAPPPPEDYFFKSEEKKEERFRAAEAPRLIFVGGSNLPFGLEGGKIESETPFHPVNLGLHYLFGLKMQLRQCEILFRESPPKKGDTVILSLEWGYFGFYVDPSALLLFDLMRNYPPGARYLSGRDWQRVADAGTLILGARLRAAMHQHISPDQWTEKDLIYIEGRFNKYGDVAPSYRKSPQPIGPLVLDATPRHAMRSIEILNEFNDRMVAQGVDVALLFPPTPEYAWEASGDRMEMVEALLRERARFPILNTATSSRYPRNLFLDTPYHLTDVGSQRRTAETIEMIRHLLDIQESKRTVSVRE